jgi:hypothetical protein
MLPAWAIVSLTTQRVGQNRGSAIGSPSERREQEEQAARYRDHVRAMNAARKEAEVRLRTELRKGDDDAMARAAFRAELTRLAAEHAAWIADNPMLEVPLPLPRKASSKQT